MAAVQTPSPLQLFPIVEHHVHRQNPMIVHARPIIVKIEPPTIVTHKGSQSPWSNILGRMLLPFTGFLPDGFESVVLVDFPVDAFWDLCDYEVSAISTCFFSQLFYDLK